MPYLLRSVFSLLILGLTPLIALNLGWNAPRRADSLSIPRRTSSKPWFRPTRRLERDLAPLSSAQKGIWAVSQTDPLGRVFHRPIAVLLDGPLNRAALEASLNRLVQRHEALRTAVAVDKGEPKQWVRGDAGVTLDFLDLRQVAADLQEARVRLIASSEAGSPFDLASGPVLKAKLLCLSDQRHVLLVVTHELVFDERSEQVFFTDLMELYSSLVHGQTPTLDKLPIQYPDFAAWQQQRLQSKDVQTQIAYWRQELEDTPSSLHLPADYPRQDSFQRSCETCTLELPSDVGAQVDALARREHVTPLAAYLAAFQFLMAYHADQDDVVVGMPVATRNYPQTENLIGCFTNVLPLRARLSDSTTVRKLLAQANDSVSRAGANSEVPLETLVEELLPGKATGQQPWFQVTFQHRHSPPAEAAQSAGLIWDPVRLDPGGLAGIDLGLLVELNGDCLLCSLRYDPALFRRETAERMLGHYRNVLHQMVHTPGESVWKLQVLGEAERRRLLVELNDTAVEFPDACIHQLFERQAANRPDAVAVIFEGRQMSYGELNRRANQLAHHLVALGAQPETLVGICLDRSLEMAVSLLAVLKAGAAYVPLDPDYPQDRLEFLIDDSNTQILLTRSSFAPLLPMSVPHILYLDTGWEQVSGRSDRNPKVQVAADNLAYVIYTSGSTGRPKGAMLSHRSACNYLFWKKDYFQLGPDDRVLQRASFSFDDSVWEFFETLMAGAAVVMLRPRGEMDSGYMVELMIREQITVACFVPSMLRILLEEPRISECTSLRRFETGAEALPVEVRDRFLEKLSVLLYNGYGPTEATVACTVHPCGPDSTLKTVPIGRPIANMQFYILGRHRQLMPSGAPGELFIGGAGLARGYLNRPELTAEKFIAHPFRNDSGSRLYRSGDVVRYLPDGNIEYRGRIDHQVKVRGFRIELEGVEHALRQHPAVRAAAATTYQDQVGDTMLVGYVVPQSGRSDVTVEVRQFLSEELPDYMVPTVLLELEALPYLSSGKIDRASLPYPEPRHNHLPANTDEPDTLTEKALASIWSKILGTSPIARQDDFFALGGHSLSAARVVLDVHKTFKVRISVLDLFRYTTLAAMAGLIDSTRHDQHKRNST